VTTPYQRWARWREQGAPRPRPSGLPARIPAAWWQRYKRDHPRKPAPPPVTPPPVTPPAHLEPVRVVFTAWNPALALDTPAGWTVGLSADLAYRAAVLAAAPVLHAAGIPVAPWADCSSTPPARITELADQLAAAGVPVAFLIGQAETPVEYRNARAAGLRVIIGNASALEPAQLADATARATAGTLTWLQEAYWGDGYGPPSTVSANGIPAAGLVAGVYPPACPHTLADYIADLPSMAATCSVYLREGYP